MAEQSKYKDGEYIALWYEDYPGYEIVKGWYDKEHCQSELNKEFEDEAKTVSTVEHKYGFWGIGRDEMGDPAQFLHERNEAGRGRFKITLAHTESTVAA